VEQPAEPPSWLSNRSIPAETDQDAGDAADEEMPAAAASETPGSAGAESPAYASASVYGHEGSYGQQDSYTESSYGQEDSYMPSSSSYGFGPESTYGAGAEASQAGAPVPPPPPYPGELAYGRGGDTSSFQSPQTRPRATVAAGHQRRANLVVARLEPWSVMKFSFLMSLVAWVVLFVAVALLYAILSGLGVFDAIQSTLAGVTSSQGSGGFNLSKYISASTILGYTMLIGAVNIVVITALSTIGSMIYNLVTHLGGGIEVTLRETD